MGFVNLHIHTEYSSLDGMARIPDLVKRVKDLGQNAVAITDHGTLAGLYEGYTECKKADIKFIPGLEAYFAHDRTVHIKGLRDHHLVLLARNKEGYENLLKLNYEGYRTGAVSIYDRLKPRIDWELIEKYNKGIIASSACMIGLVPSLLLEGKYEVAKQAALRYKSIFEHFYLEVQSFDCPEQKQMNSLIIKLGKDLNIPVICTTDSHYVNKDDAEAHEMLLAVQSKTNIKDPKRLMFECDYVQSASELLTKFSDNNEVINNTQHIANLCEFPTYLETKGYMLPRYPIEDDKQYKEFLVWLSKKPVKAENIVADYLTFRCLKGWETKKIESMPNRQEYWDRLVYELGVIKSMGFESYFLIVQDYIRYAREHDIQVGARGSGSSALVGYILDIHRIDPIKYNLLFERFLNPERISMPDYDADFQDDRRDEVKAYIAHKYGEDKVAAIATFGTLKARAAIHDIARSMDIGGSKGASFMIANAITKTIPEEDQDITLAEAYEQSAAFKEHMTKHAKLWEIAVKLENLQRQAGVHAGGVVISPRPLANDVPMKMHKGIVSTEYDMTTLEKVGLLKVDILGLSNLTTISRTLHNIKTLKNQTLKLEDIPLDDAETFKLMRDGKTVGLFQVESTSMVQTLVGCAVNSIEDVAVVLALNRPGPMTSGQTQEYINCKKGKKIPTYAHPILKEILGMTYGQLVYQEQIMAVVSKLAGFTLGGADTVRKAIGKKDYELMMKQKDKFIHGCIKNGLAEAPALKLWDDIEKFASYSFNKSHAVSYAMLSYYTGYFKAHYPTEFMSALLSNTDPNSDKLPTYIHECRAMGIKLLPPDVNQSSHNFEAVGENQIRWNLTSVSKIGEAAVACILENKPYKNFTDFCIRAKSKVHSAAMLALNKAGAFESFGIKRAQVELYFEEFMKSLKKAEKKDETLSGFTYTWPDVAEHDMMTILKGEKEVCNYYITEHPINLFKQELSTLTKLGDLSTVADAPLPKGSTKGAAIKVAVVIEELVGKNAIKRGKSKGDFARNYRVSSPTTVQEMIVWPNIYAEKHSSGILYKDLLDEKVCAGTVIVAICNIVKGFNSTVNKLELYKIERILYYNKPVEVKK